MDRGGKGGSQPTQAHVLTFIAGRDKKGVRVRAIAEHLGVAQPTATDSVAALIRKGLLKKSADIDDARAVAIRITSAGRDIVRGIGLAITSTERALETLSTREQTALLQLVIKTIRALQIAGAISPNACASPAVTSALTRMMTREHPIIALTLTPPSALRRYASIVVSTMRSPQSTAKSYGKNMRGKTSSLETRCTMRRDNSRLRRARRAIKARRKARA